VTSVLTTAALCPPGPPRPGWVAIDDGVIVEVASGDPPAAAVDLGAALLAPGFVDIQVNGVGDVDFGSADGEDWRRAGRAQLAEGVTAYCPTFVSAPLDDYSPALTRARAARLDAEDQRLPSILGVHLEGPFLGGAPGAHAIELLRSVDSEWLRRTLDAFPDLVALVTLAPEADTDFAGTRLLCARGVRVALGHSTASYEQSLAAVEAGARLVTHLFNAMGTLHQREPGLVGAALDDGRLTPTLIADLVHVHPAVLRLAIDRKPNIALVTDRVAAPGVYGAGDGAARLPDGTLAGSFLSMDRAVRNTVGLGVPIERAIAMATTIPSTALALTERGRIVPGARADLVALEPTSLAVSAVWIAGELAAGVVD
jgi:N-acetylglucosamine-6-phosphate deacetylase